MFLNCPRNAIANKEFFKSSEAQALPVASKHEWLTYWLFQHVDFCDEVAIKSRLVQ